MKKILYQISTHWDREWYLPFQGFRYHLVEVTDHLIDVLENGEIPEFVFDGQTIVLEDYLEIRPENRERLKKLIRAEKLIVGPWYVMPDELLVSGEGLIENLLVGQKLSREFGAEPWKFGYVCDIFGHIAQLPQILNGFGIKAAFIGRGLSSYPNGTDFIWRSPDGSECVTRKDNYSEFRREFSNAVDKAETLARKIGDAELTLLNFSDDHAAVNSDVGCFLKCLNASGCEVCGGFALLSELAKRSELPIVEGELIETAHQASDFRVVTGSISSYYPLKRQNDMTEKLLFQETAPLIVMGEFLGILDGKRKFYDLARKYLLKNHPHDSICGCSVDLVHQDMPYRFRQVRAIADVIRNEFRSKLAAKGNGFALTVVNTDIHRRKGVLTAHIDFPKDWPAVYTDNTGYQTINLFAITDHLGNELPYQVLHIQPEAESYIGQQTVLSNRYTVAFDADLPPFGYTSFRIEPRRKRNALAPHRPESNDAENEFLRLEIESDGSLTLTDKESGRIFRKLHQFIDDADSGNGWFHEPAAYDEPRGLSAGARTRVEVIRNGTLVNTFRVTTHMEVPCELHIPAKRRSETYTELCIVSEITIRKGQRYIEFHTEIDNTARDHRMRMIFPSGIPGTDYYTSQAFCFVDRKRGSSADGFAGREPEYVEKNTAGITGTADFAFIGAEGFHEAGVYPDGTIAVTMFRSVGKMFHQPVSETAQLIGKLKFHYALAVGCDKPELMKIQRDMQTRLPVIYTDVGNISFLSVSEERIRMSTAKPAEGSEDFIVRLYNPTPERVECDFKCGTVPFEVSMSEENAVPVDHRLVFGAYEIKTLLLKRSEKIQPIAIPKSSFETDRDLRRK